MAATESRTLNRPYGHLPNKTMKDLIRTPIVIAAIIVATTVASLAGDTSAGVVDFGKFKASTEGGEFVEVNVNGKLISLVARIAEQQEPEVADLLRGLELVRVNVIGLKDDNREEVKGRVEAIRSELTDQGWERVVRVQQQREDVAIYIRLRGADTVEGIVVTVMEPGQAVLVNVVGDIDPGKIGVIGERFNIAPLKKVGESMKQPKKQAEVAE